MDDLSIDVGVVGPYEKGWLNEGVSDRTFLLNVSAVKSEASLRGLINGAKVSSVFFNVPADGVIFPAYLKANMDAQCGASKAARLLNATGALPSDMLRLRESPSANASVASSLRREPEATQQQQQQQAAPAPEAPTQDALPSPSPSPVGLPEAVPSPSPLAVPRGLAYAMHIARDWRDR